ncbi:leucine-rich repeat-containing protein 73 isoform X1 [Entelurus aequoreus]|uniref:leucine-rich repeat-containing protein 73 isoform X1 n=1 Tax=Entelurus aequoreus TaxID=161455 RepID=UPI002B1DC492|nr:leucine-rich repeat-containing protein 73 isoform X1 [Entelurus aequoreus]
MSRGSGECVTQHARVAASVQLSGSSRLSAAEVSLACESVACERARLLCARGCHLSDDDFGRVCASLAASRSLAQLNLSLGVVGGVSRALRLAHALGTNRSLHTLLLHGNPLSDIGLLTLSPALSAHPALVSLDLGDCKLGDEALRVVCGMLPPDGAKSGLKELTLSANPDVSFKGWSGLAIAVAHSSQLRVLNLDYNELGDQIAGMLAVAVASSRTLEVLDLEGTGLTNQSAQVFLDMVENFPTSLRLLVLSENQVSPALQRRIADLLTEGDEEDDRRCPPPGLGPAFSSKPLPMRDKKQAPTDSAPQSVMLTSLNDSLLAETDM